MGIFLKKYTWVILLLLIFFATYFVAKIGSVFIASKIRVVKKTTPVTAGLIRDTTLTRPKFSQYQVVLTRNIFDSQDYQEAPQEVVKTQKKPQFDPEAPAVKTSLPIKLVSTFSVGNGQDQRSWATVDSGRGGSIDVYTVDDEKEFASGVTIKRILPDRIEFIHAYRLEYAEIEDFDGKLSTRKPTSALEGRNNLLRRGRTTKVEAKPEESGEPRKFTLRRSDIAGINPGNVASLVQGQPQSNREGQLSGFRITYVKPGSPVAKLGIRRNDVLQKINGETVSLARALRLFNDLENIDNVSLELKRGGKTSTFEYEIE